MKCNDSLLYLLQELTFNLVDLISHIEYKDFVLDSLMLASEELDKDSSICSDLLYSRFENVDEKDILTYMELDKETNPLVWSCIANYFVLVCYHSYQHSGEKYLPQTIESVDDETIEAYVSSYQQLIAENNKLLEQIPALDLEQLLNDPMVANYFGNLLRELKLKQ
ncbi:MAG: Imm6 family immunity protein [Streptococcus parasanguinis]|nr:Imm6 family immunity protein [Streptococcus parasanguinis]MDU1991645.1 Imm6 family immunity protein [Streptococcus parasanguinis]